MPEGSSLLKGHGQTYALINVVAYNNYFLPVGLGWSFSRPASGQPFRSILQNALPCEHDWQDVTDRIMPSIAHFEYVK